MKNTLFVNIQCIYYLKNEYIKNYLEIFSFKIFLIVLFIYFWVCLVFIAA